METVTEISLGKAIAKDAARQLAATAIGVGTFLAIGFTVQKIQEHRAKKAAK